MSDDLDPVIAARFAELDELHAPHLAARIFEVAPAPDAAAHTSVLADVPQDGASEPAAAVVEGGCSGKSVGPLHPLVAAIDGWRARRRPGGRRTRLTTGIAAAAVLVAGGLAIGSLAGRDGGAGGPVDATVSTPPPGTSVAAGEAIGYGDAGVEPGSVAPGGMIVVTPADTIQPYCTDLALVYTLAGDDRSLVGQLQSGGSWLVAVDAEGTNLTYPACLPPRSADPTSYVVPTDLEPGRYVICLSWDANEAGCGTFTVARDVLPAVTVPTDPDPLASALRDLGADVAGAPAGTLTLDGAVWCGVEQPPVPDPTGLHIDEGRRRCLLDAHLAAAPAVFARMRTTTEGDPIVEVWRTLADGTVELFIDATRDDFGSGRWETRACGRLTTRFPGSGVVPTTFGCAEDVGVPVVHTSEPVPTWFSSRAVLPLCGYAIRLDDVDMVQRGCFRQAIEAHQPGEFAYLDIYEGVRTARWFRVTSTGAYEVYVQTITEGERGAPAPTAVWERYACGVIGTVEGVGETFDDMPAFRPEDCAVGVDAEPPPTTTTTTRPATASDATIMASPPPTS